MSPVIAFCLVFMVISHHTSHVDSLVEVEVEDFLIPTSDDLIRTGNGTHPCDLIGSHNSTVQSFTIWGNSTVDCSVNVTVLSKGRVYLEVIDGHMIGTDFLYVKRLGAEGICKRFVAYTDYSNHDTFCPLSFSDSNFTIQFRSDITLQLTIQLTELTSLTDPELKESDCEDLGQSVEVGTHEGQRSSCQRAKYYNQVIACEYRERDKIWDYLSGWSYDTKCEISCPLNCNCSLGVDKEVIQECLDSSHKVTNQPSIMIYPTDVSNLNLSHNSLTTLNSKTFVAIGDGIERLDLGFNKLILEVGMFQNLINLLELGLTDNWLTDIGYGVFSDLKSLKQLWLYRNQLTSMVHGVFEGLGDLEKLILWGNKMSSVHLGLLANLTKLKELWLNGNKLVVLENGVFEGLGDLERLELQDNHLSSIQVGLLANLTKLKLLWLHGNKLSMLEDCMFEGLGNLEGLSLFDNKLSKIQTGTFTDLSKLSYLFLDSNKLVHLNMIASAKMCNLRKFHAENNTLTTLHPDTFQCMTSLVYILLDHNKLTYLNASLFKGLKNLEELVLADNFLRSLPAAIFRDLLNLHLLDIKNNRLHKIPQLYYMTNLKELKMTGNPFNWIISQSFDNLTKYVQIYVDQPEVCLCYATHVIKCSYTLPISQYFTCDRLLAEKAGVIVMFMLGFGAVFGNTCVLAKK